MEEPQSAERTQPSVSIVIPVYNGETTLVELTTRIGEALSSQTSSYEVLLVNDGSLDRSWHAITDISERESAVRGINLMRNYGQHAALLAGIQRARHEFIVTMDDDLQHPPEEIPALLSKLNEGYDVVYGKPVQRKHSFGRNFSSRALKATMKVVLGAEMAGQSSAFRAFRSSLCSGFEDIRGSHISIDVLLSWGAGSVTHIPVEHRARREGESGYTLRKLIGLAFDMLTGYSTVPLRFASGLGLVTSLLGLMMFLYVVIRRVFQTVYTPGFAFLAAEIALFAGLQLFAIGVIGEYLSRLHFRSMGKPPYVIRDEVGADARDAE